jgi:hypothetical protein
LDKAATRRNRGLGWYELIFTNTPTGTLPDIVTIDEARRIFAATRVLS